MKLAHRSPTYAIKLAGGRVVQVRREAFAFRKNGTLDTTALAKGKGEVRWFLRCDGTETTSDSLGDGLLRVLGVVRGEAEQALSEDAWWEQIKSIVAVTLALAEQAIPNEPQAKEGAWSS